MYSMKKVTDYICDKFYSVIYKNDYTEGKVIGLMLNYNGGNIDLLSENGVYHISYNDIVFMKPIDIPVKNLSEEFIRMLAAFPDKEGV